MPGRYHFAGDHVLVCVFEGDYTLAETIAVFCAGLDDARAEGGVDVIIDVTRSTTVKSPDDFRRVVQEIRDHESFAGRIAAVPASDDPLRFGLSRQFAALTTLDGVPMEVCTSISEALAWLAREAGEASSEAP